MVFTYILEGKDPVIEPDSTKWVNWYDNHNRTLQINTVNKITVSTVFLGIDHNFDPDSNQPVLFESMIFGGIHDGYTRRYTTWDRAIEGHQELLKLVS